MKGAFVLTWDRAFKKSTLEKSMTVIMQITEEALGQEGHRSTWDQLLFLTQVILLERSFLLILKQACVLQPSPSNTYILFVSFIVQV